MMDVGTIFHGRYELIHRLGFGSFSEVWLVRDVKTGLEEALKLFVKQNDEGIELCRAEFIKAHQLKHPRILSPSHFDVADNSPYLIMPYLSGGSLESRIGGMDFAKLKKLVVQIGSALHYLHQLKEPLSHNDIKPDNILIDSDGGFVLTDFGISHQLKTSLTRTIGSVDYSYTAGATPIAYRAPELFAYSDWQRRDPSSRSDVWSFAAVLFQVYFGVLPFNGEGGMAQLITSKAGGLGAVESLHFAVPDGFSKSYSQEVCALLGRCLQLEPDARPAVGQLIEDFLSIGKVKPKPQVAKKAEWRKQPQKGPETKASSPKRRTALFAAIASLVVAMGIVGYQQMKPKAIDTSDYLTNTTTAEETLQFFTDSAENKESEDIVMGLEPDLVKDKAHHSPFHKQKKTIQDYQERLASHVSEVNAKPKKKDLIKKANEEIYPNKAEDIEPIVLAIEPVKGSEPIVNEDLGHRKEVEKKSMPLINEEVKEEKKTAEPASPKIEALAWVTYNLEVPLALQQDIRRDHDLEVEDEVLFKTVLDVMYENVAIVSAETEVYGYVTKTGKRKLSIHIPAVQSSGGDDIKLFRSSFDLNLNKDLFAERNNIFFAYTNEQKKIKVR